MSLFQPSVLKKYLSQQDSALIQKAYKKYVKYFHNAAIQENIRNSKEEQFQEGFLRELFVDILGYTLNPAANFNLTTELKNIKGAKKVDGAILKDGNALGVIELKGTNTKDLESIRQQAFDYKANQTGCIYVITSNFEKLRFYINNAVDFEEFNLFTLTHVEFEIFYLCLAKENILANKPLSIKEASVVEEENITKKFYGDYSVFKRELYRDLVKQNRSNILLNDLPEKTTKLILFQKSQKLIDRFLFILFAEDRGLLAPNSINTVLKEWKALADLDVEMPLYDRYKQYFGYLDTGRKGTDKKEEIFAYNGGLFQPDTILDAVIIDNEMLYRHTLKLSTYDFESQVDVNILGHIFEHSLNEIESVNAEIEGTDFDKQKTKRKKDGVFYTPKYITKYIVDNTIGKLCTEKKQELGIIDEEYAKGRKNRQTTTIIKLDQQLKDYRDWLLQLTICDPACGSGAFLNQALDFLIREHAYLDELNKQLFGGFFVFPDIENQILEHNIYGVDLNEESIEIAKLSLWLRTAQPKRKLTSLNNNIKCGNSLIESKAIAGDKAFSWKEEFPEVFAKGGFDVIIGNPPYVRQELFKEIKPYLEKNYKSYQGMADLYTYFIELSIDKLIKNEGVFSIIVANKWMQANYAKPLRSWLREKRIIEIVDFGDLEVFKNVAAYPCIITISPKPPDISFKVTIPEDLNFSDLNLYVEQNHFNIIQENLNDNSWALVNENISNLSRKLKNTGNNLANYCDSKIFYGIKTGLNEAFVIDKNKRDEIIKNNPKSIELIKPFLAGRDIKRYAVDFKDTYLILIPNGWTNANRKIQEPWDFLTSNYPMIALHLLDFKNKAFKRSDQGEYWWELRSCAYYDEFNKPKLLLPDISKRGNFELDEKENYYLVNTAYIIGNADLFLLGILNSKLITFFYKSISPQVRGGYLRFIYQYLAEIPIAYPNEREKIELEKLTHELRELQLKEKKVTNKFLKLIEFSNLGTIPSKKLKTWHNLEFGGFINELNKAIKIKNKGLIKAEQKEVLLLTKKDEFEWLDIFEENKTKAQNLKSHIDTTEKSIDKMVYELYGLNEEEISIVENS
ncbi:restriction endonuclease subunit M [Flavobacterium ranwuense]|uniref:site-specific DNA-methyltransferase (adenine-specific) n=1 Tax=Flavobacterium ranwuense TaxID=2541725 RepID=A0ABY2DTE4_9FLAO|nr:TaqI-like C-terminal specificity domain-containing protein [Flavobacterium ranwuense]TDE30444.1 restriction endonuclease subunit M [Flavobacterium ranwuense]